MIITGDASTLSPPHPDPDPLSEDPVILKPTIL
jgi:hypothetical protein